MSDLVAPEDASMGASAPDRPESWAESSGRLPLAAQYATALLLVGAATLLAFVVKELIAAPNLTLIYVLPVVAAATAFGWGPAVAAVIASVLAFAFFFTQPYYSFRIDSPSDIWAAGLLMVIAAIVTTLAAESRGRALEARRAAAQAEALQSLAHVVIEARAPAEILQAAATALHQIFRGPAVIFVKDGERLRCVASAGRPEITPADEEAARGALEGRLHTRGETYPYDQAKFEFWPVATPAGGQWVTGVDFTRADGGRPAKPENFVDVVAAYLATALQAEPAAQGLKA
ncbi:MAG: hypothetical protein JWQ97_1773 [Phenylobacterium sp.]|nr:hypothetical protein [Phenylobacterium sp.]